MIEEISEVESADDFDSYEKEIDNDEEGGRKYEAEDFALEFENGSLIKKGATKKSDIKTKRGIIDFTYSKTEHDIHKNI